MAQRVKHLPADTGHVSLIPGPGRSPGGGHGNPLQSSCLENPMDRGAWRAAVHGVAKSQTRLIRHRVATWTLWIATAGRRYAIGGQVPAMRTNLQRTRQPSHEESSSAKCQLCQARGILTEGLLGEPLILLSKT